MIIFLVLNGMGVVFLLYVLVHFWKEGKRTTHGDVQSYGFQSLRGGKPKVFVAAGPLELASRRPKAPAVIRFHVPEGCALEEHIGGDAARMGGKSELRKSSSR